MRPFNLTGQPTFNFQVNWNGNWEFSDRWNITGRDPGRAEAITVTVTVGPRPYMWMAFPPPPVRPVTPEIAITFRRYELWRPVAREPVYGQARESA